MKDLPLIKKIAWSFHKTTGIEIEDLIQEGCLAYLNAIKTYDNQKGAISTYVFKCISNHLKNYVKSEREYKFPLISDEILLNKSINIPFEDNLSTLSGFIITTIKENVQIYTSMSKEDAIKHLVMDLFKKGWSRKKIISGIKDIKLALT